MDAFLLRDEVQFYSSVDERAVWDDTKDMGYSIISEDGPEIPSLRTKDRPDVRGLLIKILTFLEKHQVVIGCCVLPTVVMSLRHDWEVYAEGVSIDAEKITVIIDRPYVLKHVSHNFAEDHILAYVGQLINEDESNWPACIGRMEPGVCQKRGIMSFRALIRDDVYLSDSRPSTELIDSVGETPIVVLSELGVNCYIVPMGRVVAFCRTIVKKFKRVKFFVKGYNDWERTTLVFPDYQWGFCFRYDEAGQIIRTSFDKLKGLPVMMLAVFNETRTLGDNIHVIKLLELSNWNFRTLTLIFSQISGNRSFVNAHMSLVSFDIVARIIRFMVALRLGNIFVLDMEDIKRVPFSWNTTDWYCQKFPINDRNWSGTDMLSFKAFLEDRKKDKFRPLFLVKGCAREMYCMQICGFDPTFTAAGGLFCGLLDIHAVTNPVWKKEKGQHLSKDGVIQKVKILNRDVLYLEDPSKSQIMLRALKENGVYRPIMRHDVRFGFHKIDVQISGHILPPRCAVDKSPYKVNESTNLLNYLEIKATGSHSTLYDSMCHNRYSEIIQQIKSIPSMNKVYSTVSFDIMQCPYATKNGEEKMSPPLHGMLITKGMYQEVMRTVLAESRNKFVIPMGTTQDEMRIIQAKCNVLRAGRSLDIHFVVNKVAEKFVVQERPSVSRANHRFSSIVRYLADHAPSIVAKRDLPLAPRSERLTYRERHALIDVDSAHPPDDIPSDSEEDDEDSWSDASEYEVDIHGVRSEKKDFPITYYDHTTEKTEEEYMIREHAQNTIVHTEEMSLAREHLEIEPEEGYSPDTVDIDVYDDEFEYSSMFADHKDPFKGLIMEDGDLRET